MRLSIHLNESEVTLKILEESKMYILNQESIINEATSMLRSATSTLIIDMENIKHVDSTGLGGLIKINKLANSLNKRFRIANLSDEIMELIDLLQLQDALDMISNNNGQIQSAA